MGQSESRVSPPLPARPPVFTIIFLTLNLVVFIWMEFQGLGAGQIKEARILQRFGALDRVLVWNGEYYRLLTAMFLHIDYLHLFYNMFALYLLGKVIEPFYGHFRFILIFFLSGLAGNIVSLFFIQGISAGASGAILGLAAALLSRVSAIKGRVPEGGRRMFFFVILILIGTDILLGFTRHYVNNGAHIGGFLTGWWVSFSMVQLHAVQPWKRALGRVLSLSLGLAFLFITPLSFFQFWQADYWYFRGINFTEKRDVKKAIYHFEKAAELNPRVDYLGGGYELLAQYHYQQENFEKAIKYGHRSAAFRPARPYVHEWLERSYRRLGKQQEAEFESELFVETLTHQLTRHPKQPGSMNDLAYALAERKLHLDRAQNLAILANEKTGYQNAFYLDTLAWVLYHQGQYGKAEILMQKVLELKPDDSIFKFHLGAIWIGLGRIQEGREMVQSALDQGLDWWEHQLAERLLLKTRSA